MFAMSGISRFSPENVGCPARRSCPLSFPSMSPGSVNGGSSTSIKKPGAGSASHSCNNLGSITGVPRSSHSSMHSRSSHIPFTFFRKRSEEHTSELQSHSDLVCRLLLEKKKKKITKEKK